jgi:hypothetical protein
LDLWELDSSNEYIVNKEKEENGLKTHYVGAMQCFCKDLAEKSSE